MINPLQKILDQEKSMNALAGKLFVSTPYISNCIRGGYANPQRLAEKLEAVGMVPSSEEFLSEYRAWRKERMDALQKGNSSGEEKISPPEEIEELEKTADIPNREQHELCTYVQERKQL